MVKLKENILEEIQSIDRKEDMVQLWHDEVIRRASLKEDYVRKVKEEEIKWKKRFCCQWLEEGDKNTKFFHGMASTRARINRISALWDGEVRLDNKEDIIDHIQEYFQSLYSKESWNHPLLDNLHFTSIGEDSVNWLERRFDVDEVRHAVFAIGGDKALGTDGFPPNFFLAILE